MKFVRGPDFPTAGIIWGREGIASAYSTGRGRVVVRAKTDIEDIPRGGGREQILVTELPFQVNKAALVARIAKLAKDKQIEGISDIRDESDRKGMRVVIELQRYSQPELVLNNLYKHTPLQSSFFVNMLALVDGAPRTLTLKQTLQHYIQFRADIVIRRSEYNRRRARERAHILEGLRVALLNLEEIIALIRAAEDTESARRGLIDQFALTYIQAQAILDMQLRRLSSLERQRIEDEYSELTTLIAELDELLADRTKILAVVREETEKLSKGSGDKRRTEIIAQEATSFTKEDLTPHQQVVVTLSQRGYIKRIPAITYRLQHRGGRGVKGQTIREADIIQHLHFIDTHDTLLFFTNRGRVYAQKCYEIPQDMSRTTRGTPLVNLVPLADQERVQAMIAVPNLNVKGFVLIATRRGIIKRMDFGNLSNIRSNGLIAMVMKPGDELVAVRTCSENDEVLMITEQGQSIRFPVTQVPSRMTRATGGVKGIRLLQDDRLVSMDVAVPGLRLLTVSKRGFGKLTPVNSFPQHRRGGQGVRAFRITPKTGVVAEAQVIIDCIELMIVSTTGFIIRIPMKGIPVLGRNTQGVSIWRPPSAKDFVASVACIGDDEEKTSEDTKSPANKKGKPSAEVIGRAQKNGNKSNGSVVALSVDIESTDDDVESDSTEDDEEAES
jgi:DNA gyrase subunit A